MTDSGVEPIAGEIGVTPLLTDVTNCSPVTRTDANDILRHPKKLRPYLPVPE